jgi:hypothetical protein
MAVKCGQEVSVPNSKTGFKKIWAASLNKSKVRQRLVGGSMPRMGPNLQNPVFDVLVNQLELSESYQRHLEQCHLHYRSGH